MMEKTVNLFLKYHKDSEEKNDKREEERWTKEMELDEKRRKADQEHEYRMMQLVMQQRDPPPQNYPSSYNFVNDTTF